MLTNKSRYKDTPLMLFEDNQASILSARAIKSAEGVIEHEIQVGQRLDHLARYYYNNDRLWWRIVDANPSFVFAGNVFTADQYGLVILIPKEKG